MIYPFTDFFIRSETNSNPSMFYFRVLNQIFHSRQYLGNSRFIIRPQKRVTVRNNQICSDIIHQFREIIRWQRESLFLVQQDIISLVILYNLRFHVFTRHIRTGIHVSDETDRRTLSICISRYKPHNIPVIIHCNILHSYFLHLLAKKISKLQLSRSTWD